MRVGSPEEEMPMSLEVPSLSPSLRGNTSAGTRESSGETPASHSSKKFKNRCTEEGKKSFTLPAAPLPQGGTAWRCQERPLARYFPMGESDSGVSVWLFQPLPPQEAHFCLVPPRALRGLARLNSLCKLKQGKGTGAHSNHPVHLKTWPQTLLTGSQTHQEACPRTPRNSSPAATPTSWPIWPPVLLDSAHEPPLTVWGLPREPTQTPTDGTWILTAGSTLWGWEKAHNLERFRALPWGK